MISKHSHSVSIYTVDLKLLLDLQHSPEMITPRELFKMVISCNVHIDSDIYKKWSPFLKVQSRCCTYLIYYIVSQDWMVWLNFEPAGSSLHFFWEKSNTPRPSPEVMASLLSLWCTKSLQRKKWPKRQPIWSLWTWNRIMKLKELCSYLTLISISVFFWNVDLFQQSSRTKAVWLPS